MKPGENYRCLATLFDYPRDREVVRTAAENLARCLAEAGVDADMAPFIAFVSASGLGALQEEYVRTFDFNPLCAPYLSHHVHGDTPKKGEFMIRLKELYRRHGFTPEGNELPDHLAVLFACAAHLSASGSDADRAELISAYMAEGLGTMHNAAARKEDLYWRHPIAAAALLCGAGRQEVHHA
ncbi:MAG TPA: nitrate reductase molybdenum cofactor assembly chaperone [Desulfuromonadaceae bacterium]